MPKTLFTQGAITSRGRLVGLCTVLGLIAVSPDSLPLKAQDASDTPTPTEATKEKAPITRESLIGRWKSVKKGPVGTFIEMEFSPSSRTALERTKRSKRLILSSRF